MADNSSNLSNTPQIFYYNALLISSHILLFTILRQTCLTDFSTWLIAIYGLLTSFTM